MDSSKTLVFGTEGQLATCLRQVFPQGTFVSHIECDFENLDSIVATLGKHKPSLVINPAAYTQVDKAETETERASTINGKAVGLIADWCAAHSSSLVHYSTDYVYSGEGTKPWHETDETAPLNAYGQTKLEGEDLIRMSGAHHLIFRTSWVISPYGHNFMKTMVKLGQEREKLTIVGDQHGAPASALELARATRDVVNHPKFKSSGGVYHFTQSGFTTWFGLAEKIFAYMREHGKTLKLQNLSAIASKDYPTPAKRPANSRLDCSKIEAIFGLKPKPWEEALKECLDLYFKSTDS